MIAIDDAKLPAVNKAIRYVLEYPAYSLVRSTHDFGPTFLSRRLAAGTANLLPSPIASKVFDKSFLVPNATAGIHGSMVFLKKEKEDERPWNWFRTF
jgi:hypothetical protein